MLKLNQYNSNASESDGIAKFQETALIYVDELYGAALKFAKNERDAEDLVQETFLKAFTNFHRFQEGTNCRAWLFTILTNTFINKFRRTKKEREILNADDLRSIRQNFHNVEKSDYYTNPERGAIFKSFSAEMQMSLAKLPEEFRAVVILADLNEFSYKEVARILGCPVGTVMSRLFRGRKMMRKSLVDVAYDRGIIHDKEPYLSEESNRTRRTVREAKLDAIKKAS